MTRYLLGFHAYNFFAVFSLDISSVQVAFGRILKSRKFRQPFYGAFLSGTSVLCF